MLERPRQLRRLQQVGLPDGERAALRGPGDDVVAAGIADEVPRFPAWGGRAASEDGVGRRGTGGVISAGRGKFPRASARRGTFSRARLRARQVTAQDGRIDRGSGRHAGARRDASRRAGTRGRYREDIGRWPAPRASRGGTPPRSTCQNKKKTRNERGRRRDRETYHRNGDTFTVANGVVAPVALPGCALAPLAEVMSARVTFSSGLSPLTSHASNSQNEGYRTRMTNAPPPNSHSRESRTRITHL